MESYNIHVNKDADTTAVGTRYNPSYLNNSPPPSRGQRQEGWSPPQDYSTSHPFYLTPPSQDPLSSQKKQGPPQGFQGGRDTVKHPPSSAEDSNTGGDPSAGVTTTWVSGDTFRSSLLPPSPHLYMTSATPGGFGNYEPGIANVGRALEGPTPNANFVMNVNSPSFRPASAASTSGRSGGENAGDGIGGLGSSYPGMGGAAAFTSSSPHSRTAASFMTATNPATTNNGIINPDPNAYGDVDVTVNSGWGPGGLSSPFPSSMKNSFGVSPAPGVSSSPSLPVQLYTSGALSKSLTATVATSSATPPDPNLLSNERIEAAIQAAITNSSSPNHPDAGDGRFSRALRSRSAASSSASGSGSGYNSERDRESGIGERSKRGGDRDIDRGRIIGSEVGGGERDGRGGGERGLGGDARSVPPRDTRTLLFVGNLPYRVRWQDLKDLFRRAGTVLRADVSLGPDNRSRGYGTVLLGTAEDAGRAIDMLNGYEWQTRILEVRVDRVGSIGLMGSVGGSASSPATGSIGTMSMTGGGMGPMGVIGMSMGAGGGYDPRMMNMGMGLPYGGAGGMYSQQHQFGSSGQAFQQQSHQPQGSSPFVHEQQQHILQPTPVYQQSRYTVPQSFQPGAPAPGHGSAGTGSSGISGMNAPGRTLFVGNLPYHIQWQDLKDLFRRVPSNHPILQGKGLNATFGSGTLSLHSQNSSMLEAGYHISHSLLTFNVLRADVALGPDGRSKGFGTVVFSNVEETERARRVFSGYDFNGRQLKVHYDRVTASGAMDSPQPSHLQAMPVPIPSSSPAYRRGHNHQSSMFTSSSPSPAAFSLTQQMLNLSLGTNTSFIGSGSPESSAESPWSGIHQSQLIATSAPSTTNNGSSPDSSMSPNPASPNLGAAGFSRTRQLHDPTIPLGPEALRGRNSASELQKQQMIEQLQQQVHATQLSRQQSHSTSASPPSSSTGSVRQHNPNRPTHIPLPARTFHVEVDPSLVSLENPSVITRGASSGYDGGMSGEGYEEREESGRGLGFGYGQDHDYPAHSLEQLGLPRRRPSFVGEEHQTWKSERQQEREREQELFQLLHGSRKQQQRETQERQQVQKQGLVYSSSLSSLVVGDVRPTGTGRTTATTMTYSAPVTHSHSPTSTFARTSSSGSMSSSVSSSSSSPLTHHRHLYRHTNGGKGLVFEEEAARPPSVYEGLDILEGGNDLGMGMVESMLAQRLRPGTSSNAPSRGVRTESEIVATPGNVSNSGAGSAAGNTHALPLDLGIPVASDEPSAQLAVRNWAEEDDESSQHFSDVMDKGDKDRPTSSRTGSTTSESGSGLSSIRTSQSGSSGSAPSFASPPGSYSYPKRVRGMAQSGRGTASCTGSDADISEADGEGEGGLDDEDVPPVPVLPSKSPELPKSPNQSRLPRGGGRRGRTAAKTATDRQHPGPIELPPPPPLVPISITPSVARGSSATVQSFSSLLADGLFHQHHPFASGDQDEGHDYAQFDYSGIPTVQPHASQSVEREGKSNIEQDHAQERQRPDQQNHPWVSGMELPKQEQAQVYPIQVVSPLTPHGLPPITPSMPPFSLITGATGSLSHYQARQQRVSRQQASNNRRYGSNPPEPLSLPSQYQQGQQQPLRTPPAYVHPLGSPGSPYALGPHHPLHHQYHHHQQQQQQQQHYHSHSLGQYPLAQPFVEGVSPGVSQRPPRLVSPVHPSPLGHPTTVHSLPHHVYPMVSPGYPSGFGLGAMSPGTFWGRPGEMTGNPYMNHAVGAPVSLGASGRTAPLDMEEPKGYFDQLYMNPLIYPPSKGSTSMEEEAVIWATRGTSTDSSDSTGERGIQKEIMKDKDQGGVVKAMKQAESELPKAPNHVEMQDTSTEPSPAVGVGKRAE